MIMYICDDESAIDDDSVVIVYFFQLRLFLPSVFKIINEKCKLLFLIN